MYDLINNNIIIVFSLLLIISYCSLATTPLESRFFLSMFNIKIIVLSLSLYFPSLLFLIIFIDFIEKYLIFMWLNISFIFY